MNMVRWDLFSDSSHKLHDLDLIFNYAVTLISKGPIRK